MAHFEGVIEGVIEGVGKDIKEKLASILCVLNNQPGLRTTMLSSKTDIPVKSVERYVKRLKDAGLIKYSGSSKSGGYFLSDSLVRALHQTTSHETGGVVSESGALSGNL